MDKMIFDAYDSQIWSCSTIHIGHNLTRPAGCVFVMGAGGGREKGGRQRLIHVSNDCALHLEQNILSSIRALQGSTLSFHAGCPKSHFLG